MTSYSHGQGNGGAFSGLVICFTGLSKESRKVVKETAENLGGQYSPSLHSSCTHLVVQSAGGCKLEHVLKHGFRSGLFVVTLSWFIDSAKRNVRLSESLYGIESLINLESETAELLGTKNSALPIGLKQTVTSASMMEEHDAQFFKEVLEERTEFCLSGQKVYIDSNISTELQSKVMRAATQEGAVIIDRWFVGCGASYVVCEGSSAVRYFGHSNNIVTPIWILKMAKQKCMQRFVRVSADLAREVGMLIENSTNGTVGQGNCKETLPPEMSANKSEVEIEKRKQIVNIAKTGVRNRRIHRIQTCSVPLQAITPSNLLDSTCWSISDPASTATIDADDANTEAQMSFCFYSKDDGKALDSTFLNLSRPFKESEKNEVIFRHHFITILFPVDQFDEMGPSSRTYFSEKGFTCLQVLDLIYAFYQENMSGPEIEAAIHTDSRQADKLRSVYASEQTVEDGQVVYKRIDFLGSRRNFEKLKRVSGDTVRNVYELVIV